MIQPLKDLHDKYPQRNVIIVHESDPALIKYYEYLLGRKVNFTLPDLISNGKSNKVLYKSLSKVIAVLDGNEFYRFNDVLKGCQIPIQGLRNHREFYKKSILLAFIDYPGVFALPESRRRCILYALVSRMTHPPGIWEDDDSLVVHYRAGDIRESVQTFLSKINVYLSGRNCIRRVILVTALNYGVKSTGFSVYRRSGEIHRFQRTPAAQEQEYININWLCQQLPLPVLIYSHLNPDVDIAVLVRARHLVVSIGGFSELVWRLNQLHLEENCTESQTSSN